MKKIIIIILTIVISYTAFAGCAPSEVYPVDIGVSPVSTEAPITTEAPEVETVPTTEDPAEAEANGGWAIGDEVWFVEWDEHHSGWPYPGIVIDIGDEHLIISRGWNADGERIVAHLDDCYTTYDEAWAATGKTVVAGEGCC